jgi:C1A family cysteine protease
MKNVIKYLNSTLLSVLLFSNFSFSDSTNNGKGFIVPNQKDLDKAKQELPEITHINLNKLGHIRLRKHLSSYNVPTSSFDDTAPEFETLKGGTYLPEEDIQAYTNAATLPSLVNNSLLPSFPPIGNQGNLNSCVAWASTYYLGSHELGLLNGSNNKTGNLGILSPKWTYNLLNGGNDTGLYFTDPFPLLNFNGAPSISNLPYNGSYKDWDLNATDWIAALSARMSNAQWINGINASAGQLLLKQALNNGHIYMFGTYIDSWVFTRIVNNGTPGADNSSVGQLAATYMNGKSGSHAMTIVGYNDNLWIDVNGNSKVDPGETGAFLVANQWGTNWGNQGYVWVSYDAFLSSTAVAGGPSSNRIPIATILGSGVIGFVPRSANYKPQLVEQYALSAASRQNLNISAAISATTSTWKRREREGPKRAVKWGPVAELDGPVI